MANRKGYIQTEGNRHGGVDMKGKKRQMEK
jgi:hypothetical protein